MSLITCPECGGQISSSVKQCIHCGCKIKVCSECGSIFTANVDECKECGFKFTKKEIVENKENCIDVYNKCKNSSLINKILLSNAINIAITLLVGLCLFIAYNKFKNWATGDPLDGIMNYEETKNTVIAFIVIGFISLSITFFIDNNDGLVSFNTINTWLNINKTNLHLSIKNYLTNNNFASKTKKELINDKKILDKCIDYEMLKNAKYREKCKKKKIVSSIICVVLTIILATIVINFVKDKMQQILIDADAYKTMLETSNTEMIIMAILASLIVVLFIWQSILLKSPKSAVVIRKTKRKEFIKNNIPEGYDNYIKYFCQLDNLKTV